ncbi:MAG: BLUF domain-containing protein [Candidatus Azotimanducaceae bacterium]
MAESKNIALDASPDKLISKTYLSRAVEPFETAALEALLTSCRHTNGQEQVTGALLYHGGYFMQLIEGFDEAVERTYARIVSDSRHEIISVLFEDHISARFFPDWSMGFRTSEGADAASIEAIYETASRSAARFPINDFLLLFGNDGD